VGEPTDEHAIADAHERAAKEAKPVAIDAEPTRPRYPLRLILEARRHGLLITAEHHCTNFHAPAW
jgi:hypothetical protein